jgi:hypothetical protein
MLQAKVSTSKSLLQGQKQTEFGLDIREKNFQKNIFWSFVARGRTIPKNKLIWLRYQE